MTRRIAGAAAAPPLEDAEFFLTLGPLNHGPVEFTDAQAEAAWRAHGPTIMAKWPRDRPGFRPWAFWRFEFGEEPDYEDRVIRLAERSLLFEEEIAALAGRRTWRHIDTGAEHTDQAAVELYEAVTEALAEAGNLGRRPLCLGQWPRPKGLASD